MTTSHAFTETPLDADLIADVLDSVKRTRLGLSLLVDDDRDVPNTHRELRALVGENDTDPQTLPDPAADLHDILTHLLADYENALTRLHTLAAAPVNPAAEYERLIRAAEEALTGRITMTGEDRATRAQAFIAIADRWLSDALVQAHKRRTTRRHDVVLGSGLGDKSHGVTIINSSIELRTAEAVAEYFTHYDPDVLAIKDAQGALYLLSDGEDGPFYVGIPQAENEEGTIVDNNRGGITDEPDPTRAHPVFPITLRATGTGASYPHTTT